MPNKIIIVACTLLLVLLLALIYLIDYREVQSVNCDEVGGTVIDKDKSGIT